MLTDFVAGTDQTVRRNTAALIQSSDECFRAAQAAGLTAEDVMRLVLAQRVAAKLNHQGVLADEETHRRRLLLLPLVPVLVASWLSAPAAAAPPGPCGG